MADFGYFSDTDDSAVEELVSQAKELSALEQIAAINCSGFTDSTLPDDLESRFRRLKSLPAPPRTDPVSSSSSKNTKKHLSQSKSVATHHPKEDVNFSGNRRNQGKIPGSVSLSDEESSKITRNKRDLDLKSSSRAELVSNGSGDFSDSGNISETKIFSPVKQTRKEKRRVVSSPSSSSSSSIDLATPPSTDSEPEKKSKSKSKSSSWFDKLSPSKIIGSIWRSSPKKSPTNNKNLKSCKSFNTAATYSSGRERNIDFDEFLSDLNAFPVEDQRKMLKKALKEQQKMRKEAAAIIKMAKQASAKFDFDD
ncbi:PREDICTED: protein FAM133A-like [Camelina sativa]|uniref:Protein FAM133A-like n=1 Tax=Camelina sativa TaxID=90675 RepID=A0ABM0YEE2_CAMSA|nr:PREDICTED: protein FAM133A-like [Camelina sativa]